MDISVDVKFNQDIVDKIDQNIATALEAVGLQGETNAKNEITALGAIDTGNLRNSITYTVDEAENAVYIGTNVEYAPYVEFGTSRYPKARHFLENAGANYIDEYGQIFEQYLNQ